MEWACILEVPQDFTPDDAAEVLKETNSGEQASTLLKRLIASSVIEPRTPGGHVILRFNLDPGADYLAAIKRLIEMKAKPAGRRGWYSYLSSLEQTEDYLGEPESALTALATVLQSPQARAFLAGFGSSVGASD
jgi:hypothetical protein